MATYYVDGANGNDADDGTNPIPQGGGVGPKATLNGAEDIPVAATDHVWVRPNAVYRELLTCDVSGNAGSGNWITYQGDVAGEIWEVGGVCRITGSDADQAEDRANCITANGIDYRIFRGFCFDTTSSYLMNLVGSPEHWVVEDCAFQVCGNHSIYVLGDNQTDVNILHCVVLGVKSSQYFISFSSAGIQDAGHLIENCLINVGGGRGITIDDIGGIAIRNSTFLGGVEGVRVSDAPPGGYTANTVVNCIFMGGGTALRALNLGEIVEDFNTFYRNSTDRNTVNVGANSVTYPALLQMPLLFSGVSQVSGFKFPWWFGELSEWSQIQAITGSNEPTEDLWGIGRPVTASKNSWGSCQFMDMERETGTVHAGTASMALHDAGRHQIWVPVANESTTISVYVYREANYAGNLPQMIVKQPGQADDVTTDAAAAGQWNLLTTTLTPAADPPYVVVELVSRNTNGAADEVFFDTLKVNS